MVRRLPTCTLAIALLVLGAALLGPRSSAAQEQETASQRFKNVQVLGELPANRLTNAMLFIATSLGVTCTHCHNMDDRASDEKPAKLRAREMLRMVRQLNATTFAGSDPITCFTCHRGSLVPARAISIPRPADALPPAAPAPTPATVDAILARYIEASGGSAAIRRLRNRVARGRFLLSDGTDVAAELVVTPDALLDTRALDPPLTWVARAEGSWRRAGTDAAADLQPVEAARLLRENDLWMPLRLRERYTTLEPGGGAELNGRASTILNAVSETPNTRFRLYFDNATGLLTRTVVESASPLGWVPQAIDYYDFRRVDGVMLPFGVRRSWTDHWQAFVFASIRHNQRIDPTRFVRPSTTP